MSGTGGTEELLQWLESADSALSQRGQDRRDALRASLVGTVVRRRRRRRAATGLGAVATAVAMALAIGLGGSGPAVAPVPSGPAPAAALVAVVRDDDRILERLAAPAPTRVRTGRADDAELLALLAAADRPTGLVRIAGRVELTGDVIDPLPLVDAE
ncbi:MAG: hypothetical protein AAF628_05625 [Planctomycetota bacterium]